MKHVLLLALMFALAFGSSAARREVVNNGPSGTGAAASDVEGAEVNRQKARAKSGYQFVRQNSKSVSVMKIARGEAMIQTGTLTCTSGQQGKTCQVYVSKAEAQCNGGCYFVGVRGGLLAQ